MVGGWATKRYNDGFYNDVSNGNKGVGQKYGYPVWWAKMIGFNNDVHPIFTKRDDQAPDRFAEDPELAPPKCVPPYPVCSSSRAWGRKIWNLRSQPNTYLPAC